MPVAPYVLRASYSTLPYNLCQAFSAMGAALVRVSEDPKSFITLERRGCGGR